MGPRKEPKTGREVGLKYEGAGHLAHRTVGALNQAVVFGGESGSEGRRATRGTNLAAEGRGKELAPPVGVDGTKRVVEMIG